MASQTAKAIIGKAAPFFKANSWVCPSNEFKELSLTDYKSKWLLLFFYPLDFTFVCPTEIINFAENAKKFEENGCALIGASVDSHFSHFEYTQKKRKRGGLGVLEMPLLSDITKTIARIYGALITKGPDAGVALR